MMSIEWVILWVSSRSYIGKIDIITSLKFFINSLFLNEDVN